jgi:hypothetical protein
MLPCQRQNGVLKYALYGMNALLNIFQFLLGVSVLGSSRAQALPERGAFRQVPISGAEPWN